ncbi:MAG: radical SAM protein, partial [Anaerolineae bacterium]|nr:radical SAM protein [Anaerolineae bacterium]
MSEKNVVLLVYPNYRQYSKWKWLPTSMVFLASTLKAMGYRPVLADDRFSRERTLSILEEHIDDAALVGVGTATGSQLGNALKLAQWCKKERPDVPVVFGGPFPSAKPHLTLTSPWVDAVVMGQGELAIVDLCQEFRHGVMPPKPVGVGSLPPLPYFDGEFLRVEDYLNPETMAVNYATSSGCPGTCGFCYWHDSYRYSRFPAYRVAGDLRTMKAMHGIRNVQFDDGTFFVGRRRTMEIVDSIAPLGLRWRANGRVDTLGAFKLEDWRRIAEAGCHLIHVGLEHVSPRILRLMDKRIDPAGCVPIL